MGTQRHGLAPPTPAGVPCLLAELKSQGLSHILRRPSLMAEPLQEHRGEIQSRRNLGGTKVESRGMKDPKRPWETSTRTVC